MGRTGFCGDNSRIPQPFPPRPPRKPYPFLRVNSAYTRFTSVLRPHSCGKHRQARLSTQKLVHLPSCRRVLYAPGVPISASRSLKPYLFLRRPEKTATALPQRTCFCGVPISAYDPGDLGAAKRTHFCVLAAALLRATRTRFCADPRDYCGGTSTKFPLYMLDRKKASAYTQRIRDKLAALIPYLFLRRHTMAAAARFGGHPPRRLPAYPFLRGVALRTHARRRTHFCVRCGQPQDFRWLLHCSTRRTRFCVVGLSRFCGYVGGMRGRQALPSVASNWKKNLGRTRFCVPEVTWKDTLAAGRTCFCVRAARCEHCPPVRPYPFLRRSRAAPCFVRRSKAYPILREAGGRQAV